MGAAEGRSRRLRTDPRFSRRRRAVERAQRRRILTRALVAVTAGTVAWAVFWSPLLHVRDVRVVGARRTPAAEVSSAARLQGNENLLLLSTADVARRVAELPWVSSVDVDRMLPGTVRIRVTERAPAMVLSLGAARWTVDLSGHVLAPGVAKKGLPVLAGVQVGTVEPGVRLQTPEAVEALAVFRSLPAALRRDVVGLFAPTIERITFKLSDGMIVRYGAAERMPSKNTVLRAVLARVRAESTGASYIDVRVPTAPAVSTTAPAETTSPAPAD